MGSKAILIIVIIVLVAGFVATKMSQQNINDFTMDHSSSSPGWSAWLDELDQNSLSAIKIQTVNSKPANIWDSKFGGAAYWPRDKTYPNSKAGKPLHMIAQINFSQVPTGVPNFPTDGLLQFFIAADDLYGLEFPSPTLSQESIIERSNGYAVVYHAEIIESSANVAPAVLQSSNQYYLPVQSEVSLAFELIDDVATPADYRFEVITRGLGALSDELIEKAYNLIQSPEHQMGGFAYFTQWDPRANSSSNDEWILLFQLDSDLNKHVDIMWGDVGVGNFFIRSSDLQKLDFSRVWYHWDCH